LPSPMFPEKGHRMKSFLQRTRIAVLTEFKVDDA